MPQLMMALSGVVVVVDVRKNSSTWDTFLKAEARDFNNGFDKPSTEVSLLPLAPTHSK